MDLSYKFLGNSKKFTWTSTWNGMEWRSLLSMSCGGNCWIWNVGIPWNSNRIQLAGASAILAFHSIKIPMESSGIGQNPGAPRNGIHWNPLELHLDSNVKFNPNGFPRIPLYSVGIQIFQLNSNRFQQIPMFALVTVIIHKKYMGKY